MVLLDPALSATVRRPAKDVVKGHAAGKSVTTSDGNWPSARSPRIVTTGDAGAGHARDTMHDPVVDRDAVHPNDGNARVAVDSSRKSRPERGRRRRTRFEDCYWEVSDASGNIIDNNFISVARSFTITILSDAADFRHRMCFPTDWGLRYLFWLARATRQW